MPETPTATCIHHWKIEFVLGPHSPGVCAKCGAAKQFANSFEADDGLFNPHLDGSHGRQEVKERRKVGQQKRRQKLAL